MTNHDPAGQWPQVARVWRQLGSPLRPVDADLMPVRAALAAWSAAHPDAAPSGLILGVTPELHELPWPDRTLVTAADRTPEMIAHVWPGDPAQVVRADWRELPIPDGSVDIVLCDGGLHLLDFPTGQSDLFTELARITAPGALVVLRLFVPPVESETVDAVLADLLGGGIPNLNCLKLRIGMALQPAPESGVVLNTVWTRLHDAAGDWPQLAERLGWDIDHLTAIDAYRESRARYYFVSEETVTDLARSATAGAFEPEGVHVPDYPMGDQCPTLLLRRTHHRHEG